MIHLLLLAAAAPRETGLDVPSAQSMEVLAGCIRQQIPTMYRTEYELPNGGISIAFGEQQSLLVHYNPHLYYDIAQGQDGNRHITVRYRHPLSKAVAAKNLRVMGRKCFPYELDAAGGAVLP